MRRAKVSTPPPGDTGTTMRIGRLGKTACARTIPGASTTPALARSDEIASRRFVEMVLTGCRSLLYYRERHPFRLWSRHTVEGCTMAAKNAIPTIDLSPLRGGSGTEKREVARQIDAACTEIGFFIVTGHGFSQDLVTTARQQAIDFFALPDEDKMQAQRPAPTISGR